MFVHFHPCKEFQSKRLFCSRIVTLMFLNMFDFIWVKRQHFADNFVQRTLWYVHSMSDSTYRECFPLLLLPPPIATTCTVSTKAGFLPLLNATDNKPMASNFAKFFLKHCSVSDSWRITVIE